MNLKPSRQTVIVSYFWAKQTWNTHTAKIMSYQVFACSYSAKGKRPSWLPRERTAAVRTCVTTVSEPQITLCTIWDCPTSLNPGMSILPKKIYRMYWLRFQLFKIISAFRMLSNPLMPVLAVTSHEEQWHLFHFWHHHLWPKLASL